MTSSCGKFLKEFSLDLVYAKDCYDLEEIMMGSAYMMHKGTPNTFYATMGEKNLCPYLYVIDDDTEETILSTAAVEAYNLPIDLLRSFYSWQQLPYSKLSNGDEYSPNDIKDIYKRIATVNVIINYIKEFQNDPQDLRDRLQGEALFLRAYYYFYLVNTFGLPYNEATSSTDLGVPINVSESISDEFFSRNTVKEVYDVIVEDLNRSIDFMQNVKAETIYRIDNRAVHILLSRVYLYMGKWDLSLKHTDEAMKYKGQIRDLNTFKPGTGKDRYSNDDSKRNHFYGVENMEIIFTMGPHVTSALMPVEGSNGFRVSDDLLSVFKEGDLRVAAFFTPFKLYPQHLGSRKVHPSSTKAFDSFIIRTPEIYLNRAEALVMLDRPAEAIEALKTLFPYRYKTANIPMIDGMSGEELITFIREERRRELCFEVHRWFDLRRYAVSPKYPYKKEITHYVHESSNTVGSAGIRTGYYVLKPYGQDKAWNLPYPPSEMEFNEGVLIDNERDTREIVSNN